MKITLRTIVDAPAARAWDAVLTARLMCHVAAPLLSFEPVQPARLPEIWREGRYQVRMRLFGFIPLGRHWIVIKLPATRADDYRIRDDGHGAWVRVWDHLVTIEPRADGRCDYRDEVEVKAGLLTPLVAAFAWLFYSHRQRRWRRLAARDFVFA